jgi:hypothetical protein
LVVLHEAIISRLWGSDIKGFILWENIHFCRFIREQSKRSFPLPFPYHAPCSSWLFLKFWIYWVTGYNT